MTVATYRRPALRLGWWADRLRRRQVVGIQVDSSQRAASLRSVLDGCGIDVLPNHWTAVVPTVTVHRCDCDRVLDLLAELP